MESSSTNSRQLQSHLPLESQKNDSGELSSVSSIASIQSTEAYEKPPLPAIFTKTETMKKPLESGLKLHDLVVNISSETWVKEAKNQVIVEPSDQMQAPEIQFMNRESHFEENVEQFARQALEQSVNLCCDFTEQYVKIAGDCMDELDSDGCNNNNPYLTCFGATVCCPIAISLTIVGAILSAATEVSCATVGFVRKECCSDD